jgi:hypothetical protein
MTCRRLPPLSEDAIVDVARGREVGRGTVAAVEAHVEQCATCAARLARERQLTEGLRALAAATASAAPSAEMELQLRAAFVAQHPPSAPAWWKVAAAAAAVVMAGGWWWATSQAPDAPRHDAAAQAKAVVAPPTAPASSQPAPAPGSLPTPREAAALEHRTSGAPPVRASRQRPSSGDTSFVVLPAAASLPDFESGVIVRMELPQAALPAYGLEIVPGRRTPVEADLLIGQDGQARAIRLVARPTVRLGAEQ